MQLNLTKPELTKFIEEKVRSGDFPNPDAVVEDAVARMMEDEGPLTSDDLQAVAESDAEIDRGDCVDFDTFEAEARRKFGI